MQAVGAHRSKEKTSFDGKKFHNKDDKFQKQLQSVPTINKGKRVQGVRTDKGVGCQCCGLIHGDHLHPAMQTTSYKYGKLVHYAKSCRGEGNPNQGHKTRGESLHSRGKM